MGVLITLLISSAIATANAPGSAVFDQTVTLGGRQHWQQVIQPTGRDLVLVRVREFGADVALNVTYKKTSYHVDSPIERGGLMAIVITPTGAPTTLQIDISAQEPAAYQGRVQVTVERLRPANHEATRAWLHFMSAGQSYAQLKDLRATSNTRPADITDRIDTALREYSAAADASKAGAIESLHAQAMLHVARVTYDKPNGYKEAVPLSEQALTLLRTVGDEFGASRALSLNAAAVRDGASALKKSSSQSARPAEVSSQFALAIERFQAVERFHTQRQEWFAAAQAANNIGLTSYLQGEYDEALAEYERATAMFRSIADTANEARSVQNAALVNFELGDRRCAKGFAQALAVLDRDDDMQLYGDTLNNAALCHHMLGQFDVTLSYYESALRVHTQLQNEVQIARTLHGMGATYFVMGDLNTAFDLYTQALNRRRLLSDERGRATTLSALGNISCARGEFNDAIARYREALTPALTPMSYARIELRLTKCLTRAGLVDQALSHLQHVEASHAYKEGMIKAWADLEQGRIHAANGNWQATTRELKTALSGLAGYELVDEQAEALVLLATAARARNNSVEAMRYVDQGIRLGEQIRARSNNPELRATLFAPWRKFYDLKIALILQEARDRQALPSKLAWQALRVAEAARARALEEVLLESASGTPSNTDVSEREQVLAQLSEKRIQLALRQERSGNDDPRAQYLLRDIAGLRTRLDAMSSSGTSTHLVNAAKWTLPKIPDNTAVLMYWVGEQQALVWVLTRDGLESQRLSDVESINAVATQAHAALSSTSVPTTAVEETLRNASAMLLPPLRKLHQKQRWIVLADGPLHYVPFAALPIADSNIPAIAVHEISIGPALRLLSAPATSQPSMIRALLIADPVFDRNDDRFAALVPLKNSESRIGTRISYPRLRGSSQEIERISNHLTGVEVTRLTAWDANRDQVLNALRTPYSLVHIATHSRVDADVPQLSAIVLSGIDKHGQEQVPWLHASELRGLHLKDSVFVLSACESALGKTVAGEGLVGLTYALLGAGARGVLASNWRVSDSATVDYMDALYSSLRTNSDLALAAASAARRLLKSERWREPRYWAAFVAYQNEI